MYEHQLKGSDIQRESCAPALNTKTKNIALEDNRSKTVNPYLGNTLQRQLNVEGKVIDDADHSWKTNLMSLVKDTTDHGLICKQLSAWINANFTTSFTDWPTATAMAFLKLNNFSFGAEIIDSTLSPGNCHGYAFLKSNTDIIHPRNVEHAKNLIRGKGWAKFGDRCFLRSDFIFFDYFWKFHLAALFKRSFIASPISRLGMGAIDIVLKSLF